MLGLIGVPLLLTRQSLVLMESVADPFSCVVLAPYFQWSAAHVVGQHCSDTLAGLMKRSVHCWTVSMGLVTVCPLVFGDMKIS